MFTEKRVTDFSMRGLQGARARRREQRGAGRRAGCRAGQHGLQPDHRQKGL